MILMRIKKMGKGAKWYVGSLVFLFVSFLMTWMKMVEVSNDVAEPYSAGKSIMDLGIGVQIVLVLLYAAAILQILLPLVLDKPIKKIYFLTGQWLSVFAMALPFCLYFITERAVGTNEASQLLGLLNADVSVGLLGIAWAFPVVSFLACLWCYTAGYECAVPTGWGLGDILHTIFGRFNVQINNREWETDDAAPSHGTTSGDRDLSGNLYTASGKNNMQVNDKRLATVVIVLLILNIFLIGMPVFRVAGFGVEMTYTFEQLSPDWAWAVPAVRIMNIVAIICLLLPMLEKVANNILWYLPAVASNAIALLGVISLIQKKNEAMESSGMDYLLDAFSSYVSIEYTATTSMIVFIAASVVSLLCVGKLILNAMWSLDN